ncbi:hypothetical protein [Frigoribacterium sp. Leaf186]|uniref:helix-turn-helix domain-containing protein n=1 Tax=Frigoribacterium sp. Leaf186 TaxID=1736293 RepID=UPI001910FC45|nr:hypothetical protein [Frigoribacterium sp. Leaf186]
MGVYSNPMELPFTPEELQKLAIPGDREAGLSTPVSYEAQGVSRRLGPKKVAEAVRRYESGESARSIAAQFGVSTSAVLNLLRDNAIVVKKRLVTDAETKQLATEYEAGDRVRELEQRHRLSHGAVMRALHRSGVTMRAKAPRCSA